MTELFNDSANYKIFLSAFLERSFLMIIRNSHAHWSLLSESLQWKSPVESLSSTTDLYELLLLIINSISNEDYCKAKSILTDSFITKIISGNYETLITKTYKYEQ